MSGACGGPAHRLVVGRGILLNSEPSENWTGRAVAELSAGQNADGGWGYLPGYVSNTEATALACLALLAASPGAAELAGGVAYLDARRMADGAFGGSAVISEPTWAASLAGMAMAGAGRWDAVQTTVDWLLAAPVFTLSPVPVTTYQYDTSIPGWPWTNGDYSFVEPTGLAMRFLKQQGFAQHDRVRQAVAMLLDRAIATGGWNYGEPMVLHNPLLPAIVPTAAALIGLADEPSEATQAALSWLVQQRGTVTSLFSLGWAAIALNVWGALDEGWTAEVIAGWDAAPKARRNAMETALCLLGLSPMEGHPLGL